MNKLPISPNNNLSNRLGNTFVDSSTCSNLNDLDTGIYNVNNYDGKITNVPFPGGSFMCVVAKQGDLYKYLLASVEGSLATKSLINGSWSSWAYYALKSDLFAVNWITNPNTCATPFSVVNGWSHDLANVPDDAKNTWNSLQTTWIYPTDVGDLTKVRLQILITGNNTVHTRMYENGNFENWS